MIPIVVYTGSDPWDEPLTIAGQMDLPVMLGRFVPTFDVLSLMLKATPRDELTASQHPFAWLLRVIQEENASFDGLDGALREALAHLDTLVDTDRDAWWRALVFLCLLIHLALVRRRASQGA